ncbi:CWF complex protein sap62 [Malassezia furfur]|uniref:CWF complex protein sap62 n=1 Tax=Malassezia furfur TaxID=55194 RepID=A0ABY8ETT8_MALFU|nr:CWF complex protein sap62 [Malassezia furfur]
MDYQNRAGNKGAGVADASQEALNRRERLRKLALETLDLSKDPYALRNSSGNIECRLCLTVHANDGSYLSHIQGKKHQMNLARRAAKEAQDDAPAAVMAPKTEVPKKSFVKIGRPGYKITKVREPYAELSTEAGPHTVGGRLGLLFQVSFPEIKEGVVPLYRLMSSFEQRQEPPNRAFQYVVIAAEPYETIAFKIQSREVDQSESLVVEGVPVPQQRHEPGTWSFWDPESKLYTVQVLFRQ